MAPGSFAAGWMSDPPAELGWTAGGDLVGQTEAGARGQRARGGREEGAQGVGGDSPGRGTAEG